MSSGIQKIFQLICAFKRILSPQNRKVHPAPNISFYQSIGALSQFLLFQSQK